MHHADIATLTEYSKPGFTHIQVLPPDDECLRFCADSGVRGMRLGKTSEAHILAEGRQVLVVVVDDGGQSGLQFDCPYIVCAVANHDRKVAVALIDACVARM